MTSNVQRLVDIMARLRNPEGGCPWDLEQDFKTIAPHTIEEIYELVEAIENDDPKAIKDELGDVLFQVIFYAQMGHEKGWFDLESVAAHTANKMVERHPHVFAERDVKTAADVLVNWEKDKEVKRKAQADKEGKTASVLDGVSTALPAATRAVKLQKRAARVGFDWKDARDVLAKIREEIGEFEKEMGSPKAPQAAEWIGPGELPLAKKAEVSRVNKDAMEDELGDVLFAVTNLARKLEIDPETALRRTNMKFERRFKSIEEALAKQGKKISEATLAEMESLWNEAKAKEKASL